MYGHSRFFFWGDGGGNGGWWPSCPKNLHNARMYECWNGDAKAFKSPNETKTFTFQTAIPRGLKFLRDFNYFADFGFFEFRGNKFSRIWILNFTLGNNFPRISCAVLESDKTDSLRVVALSLSPLSETQKKPERKKRRVRSWGWVSPPGSHAAIFFLAGFFRVSHNLRSGVPYVFCRDKKCKTKM